WASRPCVPVRFHGAKTRTHGRDARPETHGRDARATTGSRKRTQSTQRQKAFLCVFLCSLAANSLQSLGFSETHGRDARATTPVRKLAQTAKNSEKISVFIRVHPWFLSFSFRVVGVFRGLNALVPILKEAIEG